MEMKQIRIIVEGNIGSGKSELIERLKETPDVVIVPEALEAWRNYNGKNMLELMYSDPKKYMEEFQLMVLETGSTNYNAEYSENIIISERSIFSTHYVFSQLNRTLGFLTDGQFKNMGAKFLERRQNMIKPDFIIYLRTDPKVCYERMKKRNRPEEDSVSLDYLKSNHELHENLFIENQQVLPCVVIVINGDGKREDAGKKCINFIQTFAYKSCSKCKCKKTYDDYFKGGRGKDGLQGYCKECNRERCRDYMNEKYKDPKFYTIHKMRNSLSRCETMSTLKPYLGCTNKFFNDWLDWQRGGRIIVNEELDHVLPVAHFGDVPEICWHWSNISPISREENSRKRAKIFPRLYERQLSRANDFLEHYEFPSEAEREQNLKKLDVVKKHPKGILCLPLATIH